jgi:hypothetical protein
MAVTDSALDPQALAHARALVRRPERRSPVWPVLCAAAFAATSALTLAAAMILSPPTVIQHIDDRAP